MYAVSARTYSVLSYQLNTEWRWLGTSGWYGLKIQTQQRYALKGRDRGWNTDKNPDFQSISIFVSRASPILWPINKHLVKEFFLPFSASLEFDPEFKHFFLRTCQLRLVGLACIYSECIVGTGKFPASTAKTRCTSKYQMIAPNLLGVTLIYSYQSEHLIKPLSHSSKNQAQILSWRLWVLLDTSEIRVLGFTWYNWLCYNYCRLVAA